MTPEIVAIIGEVSEVARGFKTQAVLIGALVTDLLQAKIPKLPAVRRTNDADFAVLLPDWRLFREMKQRLVGLNFRQDPRQEHRMMKDGIVIDIIPYGLEQGQPPGFIIWPESKFKMNVVGFDEACSTAVEVDLPGGVRIKSVTAQGLALLKTVAFLDRLDRGDEKYKNDAQDLDYWFQHFAEAQDLSPYFVFDLGLDEVSMEQTDAALLGFEVGRMAPGEADKLLETFIQHAEPYSRFVSAVVPVTAEEPGRLAVVQRLRSYYWGYASGRLLRPGLPRVLKASHGNMSGEVLGVAGVRHIHTQKPFLDVFISIENRGKGDTIREARLILDREPCEASGDVVWKVRLEYQDTKDIRFRFYPSTLDSKAHRGLVVLGTVGRTLLRFAFDASLDNRWPSDFWDEGDRLQYE